MACVLSRHGRVFQGLIGRNVEVAVRSQSPANTVRIAYAGSQDGTPPFTFAVQAGKNKLLVQALGCNNAQRITVVEVDGAVDCKLKTFRWSGTNFFTTMTIEGL